MIHEIIQSDISSSCPGQAGAYGHQDGTASTTKDATGRYWPGHLWLNLRLSGCKTMCDLLQQATADAGHWGSLVYDFELASSREPSTPIKPLRQLDFYSRLLLRNSSFDTARLTFKIFEGFAEGVGNGRTQVHSSWKFEVLKSSSLVEFGVRHISEIGAPESEPNR